MSQTKRQATIKERILQTVEGNIEAQTAKGVKTYNQTLDDCAYEAYDWQNMINEELIDALQYQQKEIVGVRAQLNTMNQLLQEYQEDANYWRVKYQEITGGE